MSFKTKLLKKLGLVESEYAVQEKKAEVIRDFWSSARFSEIWCGAMEDADIGNIPYDDHDDFEAFVIGNDSNGEIFEAIYAGEWCTLSRLWAERMEEYVNCQIGAN